MTTTTTNVATMTRAELAASAARFGWRMGGATRAHLLTFGGRTLCGGSVRFDVSDVPAWYPRCGACRRVAVANGAEVPA